MKSSIRAGIDRYRKRLEEDDSQAAIDSSYGGDQDSGFKEDINEIRASMRKPRVEKKDDQEDMDEV